MTINKFGLSTFALAGGTHVGIAYGIGAGAVWGLAFLAPELVRDFGPLHLSVGRYLAYGCLSLLLVWPRLSGLRSEMTREAWWALTWISLSGNILYYGLLTSAVQIGGIAMTSLVIGFLPVAVTVAGSRDRGAVSLSALAPSLLLCGAGTLCMCWQALASQISQSGAARGVGLLLAAAALASWTIYAIGNKRWMQRMPAVSAQDWNLLTGLVTGAQALILVPIAVLLDQGGHGGSDWARLCGVSVGMAVVASIVGNGLWNRMSQLLPLTLAGQMILFETLFALIYGFLWEQRLPTALEIAAFMFLVLSVVLCIRVHGGRTQGTPSAS